MDDDDRMTAVLHRAVGTLDPPTARLVAGGMARGRRRKRLVRGAETLSTLALLAGVVAFALAFVPSGRAEHQRSGAPLGGRPSPTASSSSAPRSRGTVAMTPQALLQIALDLLPRHAITSRYGGESGDGSVVAGFVYDDGHGPARIDVVLEHGSSDDNIDRICASVRCTTRPDGSRLASVKGDVYPSDPSRGAQDWNVWLGRPDGVLVGISEYNSVQEKGAPISRPTPPFTLAELTSIVDSPMFQLRISHARAAAAAGLFRRDSGSGGPTKRASKSTRSASSTSDSH